LGRGGKSRRVTLKEPKSQNTTIRNSKEGLRSDGGWIREVNHLDGGPWTIQRLQYPIEGVRKEVPAREGGS